MPGVQFRRFAGELPKISPERLPENQATLAENTDFRTVAVKPLRDLALHETVSMTQVKGIHKTRYGKWLYYDEPTDIVDSVVGDDPYDRIFYVVRGQDIRVANKSRAGSGSLALGVPAPEAAPAATVLGEIGEGEKPETRVYVATLIGEFGEEGPPSPATSPVDAGPNQTVELRVADAVNSVTGSPVLTRVRIYRSTGGPFLFVADADPNALTFTDDVGTLTLGEQLPSINWYPPPDSVEGLISVPGGFLAAWRSNEILFSELQLPHAWPFEYRQAVDWKIVGAGAFGNSVVVCTEGAPYIAQGAAPEAMQLQKIPSDQSCASADSVVSMRGGVVYASPEGLVRVGNAGVEEFGRGLFTESQWADLNPSTMRGALWEGLYICLHDTGAFLVNPDAPDAGIVNLSFASNAINATYTDLSSSDLYVAEGSVVYRWASGDLTTFKWRSKILELPAPEVLKFVQVRADGYPVDVTVYDDQGRSLPVTVESPAPVRVPNPKHSRTYSVEISGTSTVTSAVVGSTMAALREV